MDREERRQLREDLKKKRMECVNDNGSGRVWSGILLLAVGGLLLARQVGANIPAWMFHWPMLLIAIGLMLSLKSGFRNAGGLIMILVGVAFLLNEIIPDAHMENFIWPGIFILAGIVFIVRPRSPKKYSRKWEKFDEKWNNKFTNTPSSITDINTEPVGTQGTESDAEIVEVNAVFGSVNKLILSKNFKGGEVNAFMGGAELNLLQADIKNAAELEVNAVFGGAKLIVPGNWHIKNQMTAVFGGVEDKRHAGVSTPDPNKVLILKGACVFGGIEIRNF